MPSDQIATIIAAFITGGFGTILGIVKFVVPRLDRGYKTAIEIQERRYEVQSKTQELMAGSLSKIAQNELEQNKVLEQQNLILDRLLDRANSHDRDVAVHRQHVDDTLAHFKP